ncbi:site-specific integrase [Hirschia maritima]|uniref:site-specific integrase n=1 Tax=Hirschia maritima TaxID=1121961 RepID=UPI00037B6BDB|nr:site-specific integrase [Hirschia maritima]
MKTKLSLSNLKALKPSEKKYVCWDSELAGFGARVQPTGKVVFFVRQSKFALTGTTLDITIGALGQPWTPANARSEATRLLLLLKQGVDPRKQIEDVSYTINSYFQVFSDQTNSRKKQSSIELETSLFKRHISPYLGKTKLKELNATHISRFMKSVAKPRTVIVEKTKARGKAIIKGGRPTANRAYDLLSAMLNYAVSNDIIDKNPAKHISKYPTQKKERFLSDEELKRLGVAIRVEEANGANEYPLMAIKLLLFTGARKNEILSLKWTYIDWERGVANLPDSKTGAKTILLSPTAIELMKAIPRLEGSEWVFPASRGSGHYTGLQKVWKKVREFAQLDDVRLHDLRHTFASLGASRGHSLYIVGKALGHTKPTTTQRYAHLADDPVASAVMDISAHFDKNLNFH